MSRRVVITGIGLVSSLGIGTAATWRGLLAGTSGVTRVTRFDVTGYAAQIAAEVKGFDPLQFIEKKDVKKMDVFIQYAIAPSQFAMDDASLQISVLFGTFNAAGRVTVDPTARFVPFSVSLQATVAFELASMVIAVTVTFSLLVS